MTTIDIETRYKMKIRMYTIYEALVFYVMENLSEII